MKFDRKTICYIAAAGLGLLAASNYGTLATNYPSNGEVAAPLQDWLKTIGPAALSIVSAMVANWPATNKSSAINALIQLISSQLSGDEIKGLTVTVTYKSGDSQTSTYSFDKANDKKA